MNCQSSEDLETEPDFNIIIQLTAENSELHEKVRELTEQIKSLQLSSPAYVSVGSEVEVEPQNHGHLQNSVTDSLNETFNELIDQHEILDNTILERDATIADLQEQLRNFQDEGVFELIKVHEQDIQNLNKDYEDLIKDLLIGCDGLFSEMKASYLRDEEKNPALKNRSGIKIFTEFQNLSLELKGIIVTGICIISTALGTWVSWGFIAWAWRKLLDFAEGIAGTAKVLASWLPFLVTVTQSEPFQRFLKSWQEGKSLEACFKEFLDTVQLSSIMKMAPKVLSGIKVLTSPVRL